MNGYTVELVKRSGLTDAERRRRLTQAFDLLLQLVDRVADDAKVDGPASSATSNPDPSQGRDART